MKKIEIVRHTPEKCLKNEILSYTRRKKPSQNDLAFSMKFACASEITL